MSLLIAILALFAQPQTLPHDFVTCIVERSHDATAQERRTLRLTSGRVCVAPDGELWYAGRDRSGRYVTGP